MLVSYSLPIKWANSSQINVGLLGAPVYWLHRKGSEKLPWGGRQRGRGRGRVWRKEEERKCRESTHAHTQNVILYICIPLITTQLLGRHFSFSPHSFLPVFSIYLFILFLQYRDETRSHTVPSSIPNFCLGDCVCFLFWNKGSCSPDCLKLVK